MTHSFETAIYLLACASRGIKPDIENEIDLKQIYSVVKSQNILPIIYPILNEMEWNAEDKALLDIITTESLMVYTFQCSRQEFVRRLFEQFDSNNINFCMMKGDAIAQFYSEPLLRPSSDIDIRVSEEDVEKSLEILRENEFVIDPFHDGDHHYKCHHPRYGLLELHIAFCLTKTNAVLFNNTMSFDKPYVKINIPDIGAVNIMEYTDGYIYLINHFIKHFISSGAGIRHLMDITFYLENYIDKIDMDRVERELDSNGYIDFYKNMMYICHKYLLSDICGKYACRDRGAEEKANKILTDMENGGVFGHADPERLDFYNVYLKLRLKKQGESYGKYRQLSVRRIFPSIKELEIRYKYLEKSHLLYPIAFIQRIIEHIRMKRNKAAVRPKDIKTAYSERIALLSDIGLM